MKKLLIIPIASLLAIWFLNSCRQENDDDITTDDDNGSIITDCTTTGTVSQSSDTDVEAMRQAILTFRSSLNSTLLAESSNCLDDDRFTIWHNTPGGRDGITYGELSETQLENFKSLLQLFLSSDGYQKVDGITTLAEGFLSEINSGMWHPDNYAIDMFGDPENDGSWGFQLDGHHCAINFLVHGDNVSIVPAFLGAEPVAETYNGTTFDIFLNERDLALTLYNGFSAAENESAVSSGSSATMVVGPASRNGDVDPYAGTYDYSGFTTGLKYSEMSATTQANLIALMKEYVYNLNTTFADVWWSDISANIDDTYFVWLDNVETPTATTQFYYRIYNPYLWVEYNMENPVGAGIDQWNHAHTITRIPNNPETDNGGDYGIFARVVNKNDVQFLAQHYNTADHHHNSLIEFDYKYINGNSHSHEHHHSHSHEKG